MVNSPFPRMQSKREQIERIFLEATERPPGERAAFVRSQCSGNDAMRAEIESLLDHYDRAADKFLAVPPADALVNPIANATPGNIGRYRLVRKIGEGGMGEVFEAIQDQPKRTVALKIIRAGLASPDIERRFRHEVQILGQLQHPGIACIYDAGTAETSSAFALTFSVPFFVMELVRGVSITDYAHRHNLTIAERLELVARVCDAVQHAHQKGVIHRDLKPANVLVAPDEKAEGERSPGTHFGAVEPRRAIRPALGSPKILDFGVARMMHADPVATAFTTQPGQLIGTLAYMSPEQAAGEWQDLDTRSDVYSLGVILYQLLAGSLPYNLDAQPSSGLPEIARAIKEDEPSRVGAIAPACRGDVETIVAKAMHKSRGLRYQSVADLASDIRRYLAGEPIEARRDSAMYMLRRRLRRSRELVVVASLLVAALAVLAIITTGQSTRNAELAHRAEFEAMQLRKQLYINRIGVAHSALLSGDLSRVRVLLNECPVDLRNWEWYYLNRIADRSTRSTQLGFTESAAASASRDGSHVASWRFDTGLLSVVNAQTGSVVVHDPLDVHGHRIALSPDASEVVIADGEGGLAVYELPSLQQRLRLRLPPEIDSGMLEWRIDAIDFRPDGLAVVTGTYGGTAMEWMLEKESVPRQLLDSRTSVPSVCYSGDGNLIVFGFRDGTITVLDAHSGQTLHQLREHDGAIHTLSVSPDNTLLASGSSDGEVRLWNLDSGELLHSLGGHSRAVNSVAFSEDGQFLVSGSTDLTVRVWGVADGKALREFRGHVDRVLSAGFIDNRTVISQARDGTARWWSLDAPPDVQLVKLGVGQAMAFAANADGTRVIIGGTKRAVRLVNGAETGWFTQELLHDSAVFAVDLSDDGGTIATGGGDRVVRIWDAGNGSLIQSLAGHDVAVHWVDLSRNADRLASSDFNGVVIVWDVESGEPLVRLQAHNSTCFTVSFDSDAQRIVTAGLDQRVRVWDAHTGKNLLTIPDHQRLVYQAVFSPDGTQIASVGEDGVVRSFDARTGAPLVQGFGHRGAILGVAFSPDGSRLVSCGDDLTLRVWDAHSGYGLLTLQEHTRIVQKVAFTADGSRILSTGDDDTLRIWETDPTR